MNVATREIVLMPTVLNTKIIALQLGRTTQAIQMLCKSGKIKAHKKGKYWFVLPQDLRNYITSESDSNKSVASGQHQGDK